MHFDPEQVRRWLQTVMQIAAFGGAVLVAVWQQKRIDDRLRDDRRRKHLASRVTLPISLAKINRYSEECAAFLRTTYPPSDGHTLHSRSILPDFPHEVIPALKECVESGDQSIIEPLAELIRFCQVQNSRMTSTFSRIDTESFVDRHTYNKAIYDVLRLWAIVEQFYEYGRLDSNKVQINIAFDRIKVAAGVLGMTTIEGFSSYIGSLG